MTFIFFVLNPPRASSCGFLHYCGVVSTFLFISLWLEKAGSFV